MLIILLVLGEGVLNGANNPTSGLLNSPINGVNSPYGIAQLSNLVGFGNDSANAAQLSAVDNQYNNKLVYVAGMTVPDGQPVIYDANVDEYCSSVNDSSNS